jgi:hypothetical protein
MTGEIIQRKPSNGNVLARATLTIYGSGADHPTFA